MTAAQDYLKAIGWQGTEEEFYRSKGLLPEAPKPKPFDYQGYWDPEYYLGHNPDVKAAGVDPLGHYNEFGWHEGRDPSSLFDTSDYLSQYSDVAAAGVNPLEHYLNFGMKEYRNPKLFTPTDQTPITPGGGTPTVPPPQPPPPPAPPSRGDLTTEARGGIRGYFMGKGANPDKYNQQIMDSIASRLAGITNEHLGESGLFSGLGEGLYDELAGEYRNTAKSAFDAVNSSYQNPFGTTFDDNLINTILGEQRAGADTYVNNALARGLTDEAGAGLARADLDRQQTLGSSKLNTLGETLIGGGNTAFGQKQTSRRNALGNIGLDASYDTSAPDMDTVGNEFMLSLGKDLRKNAGGPGVVFSTANLPGIGNLGSGAFLSNKTPYANTIQGGGASRGTEYDPTKENVLF